jgi:hypothetical protein
MSLSRIILLVRNFPSLPASGDLLTPNVMRTVGSSTAIGTCVHGFVCVFVCEFVEAESVQV